MCRPETREARFNAKVDRSPGQGPEGDCWMWTGVRHPHMGYGKLCLEYAHRVSWELHNGPIPEGLKVLHRCDNGPCVRPDHLFLGTDKDNMHDMIRKGRYSIVGEMNPNARFTREDIETIRKRFASGEPANVLAKDYRTRTNSIRRIIKRERWASI